MFDMPSVKKLGFETENIAFGITGDPQSNTDEDA